MKEKAPKKEKPAKAEFAIEGVVIAPGVVETIVSLAVAEVEGVAAIGSSSPISAIAAAFNSGRSVPTTGIEVKVDEDSKVSVVLEGIKVYYDFRIVEVAANIREAVADALKAQIGAEVVSVDVHVDEVVSKE